VDNIVLLLNERGMLQVIFPFDFLLKPIPIWCIAYFCYSNKIYLITTGLLFGSLGDIFLTFQNRNEFFFMLGLGSFLIGHIFYIIYFIKNFKFHTIGLGISIVITISSIGISNILLPTLPENLTLPVLIYIIVISLMVISTTFYHNFNYFAIIGAILFLISDTIIAWNKFIKPIPFAHLYIMLLYYLGQWGIGFGSCKINKEPS
jgi:uncharacterized membrane protein YhhN